IRHDAFQFHARIEGGDRMDAVLEVGCLEIRPWIAAGFFQFGDNVPHGRDPEDLISKILWLEPRQDRLVANQGFDRLADGGPLQASHLEDQG
ncbi:MAG: hypothetical protein ABJJ69_21395, partial [Paracoccaceae bacterium]